MLLQSLKYSLISVFVFLLLIFVFLNFMTGCENWEEPNCITPSQFISIVTGGLI
jgi:hypothetical protein